MGTKSILSISLIAVLLIGVTSFDNAFASHTENHSATGDGNSGAIHQQQDSIDFLTTFVKILETEIELGQERLFGSEGLFSDIIATTDDLQTQVTVNAMDIELGRERLYGHEQLFGGFVNSTLDDLQTQVTVNAIDIELGKERLFGAERLFSDIIATLDDIATSITNLQTNLATETTQRETADTTLQTNIDNISLTPGPEGPVGADGSNLKTYVLKELDVGSRSGPSLACDTGDIALSGGFAKSPDDLIHFMFIHPDVLDRVQFGTQDIDDLANIDLYTVCADTTAPFRP